MPVRIIKVLALPSQMWYYGSTMGKPTMTTFALLSELHRLSPDQISRIDHIISDDGDWDEGMISHYINQWRGHNILTSGEDWTRRDGELL